MKGLMDKYSVLIKKYIKVYLKYPMRLFLKLIYLPIQMLIYIFLWNNVGIEYGMDISYMILYYLIIGLLNCMYPFRHIAVDIQNDVLEGNIYNYLVRPQKYYMLPLCKYVAWITLYNIVFIPVLIYTRIKMQLSLYQIAFFVISVFIGKIIEFLIWYNVGLMSFFIEKIRGVMSVVNAIMLIVSGSIIPLSLLPKIFQLLTYVFPFRMYVYVPSQILLEDVSQNLMFINIIIGGIWIIILSKLASFLWRKGIHRLEANV